MQTHAIQYNRTRLTSYSIGASLISFGLPIACYAFTYFTNDVSGCPPPSLLSPSTFTLDKLKQEVGWQGFSGLLNVQSAIATIGYYTLSLVLGKILPATEVQGVKLKNGKRLDYRMNSRSRHRSSTRNQH